MVKDEKVSQIARERERKKGSKCPTSELIPPENNIPQYLVPRSIPPTFTYTHNLQPMLYQHFSRLGRFPLCVQGSHVPIPYPQLCFRVP